MAPPATPALLLMMMLAATTLRPAASDVFWGCVRDGPGPRALPDGLEASGSMTTESCGRKAALRGQSIYGIEYGRECYAGDNNLTRVTEMYGNSTDCTMPCSGNASQTCGGPNALSLWTNPDLVHPNTLEPLPADYQGCYTDAAGSPRMTRLWADAAMTVQFCTRLAAGEGYSVAGLQYSRECWGSNSFASTSALGPSTACTMPCAGNASQACGGNQALSVYNTSAMDAEPPPPGASPPPGTAPPPPPPPAEFNSSYNVTKIGCYADTGARMIPNQLERTDAMTPFRCSQLAYDAGYSVFGVQYKVECWASNNLTQATILGESTACGSFDCGASVAAGDCGGPDANTVYTQALKPAPPPPPPPPPSSPPPPAAPLSTLNITALGCFADGDPRALAQLFVNVNLTVDACAKAAYAAGYAVFGIQWSQECWAGSEASATQYGASNACTSQCYSDPQGSCGGGMANSVYRLPPPPEGTAPPPPPPPPTQINTTLNITPLGCWRDDIGSRALPVQLQASPTMTVDACAKLALASTTAYTVVGLQYTNECYASKNETQAKRYGPAANCNSPCVADPPGSCGGGLANSLYLLPPRPPAPPRPPPPPPAPGQEFVSLGCFADGAPRRLPANLGGQPNNMTVEACAQLAREQTYTVFAVQYGQECFGSWDLEFATALGALGDESCNMPCTGNPDDTCGGPLANRLFKQPPPPPPAGTPAYTYLGCFQDDVEIDQTQEPPQPTRRRMWRRLGQLPEMESWECARRAEAAGYPLFGLTSGEVFPNHGKQCWGAFNLSHVTAHGPSVACTNRCKPWPSADACGGDYAISLYRVDGMEYDAGAGGRYEYLLEMPISVAHVMQATGQDNFYLIEFFDQDHPSTWDRQNTTYMWFRGNNSYRSIINKRDASCGMWNRMPDGDFMGFSGYFGASGTNHYSVWATMWYHRHQYRVEDFGDAAMPFGRWYGGSMTMPDGRSYVTGGDKDGPGFPRALGSDVWDPAHKTWVGRFSNMGLNEPYLPLNQPLFGASTVGGYYPGLWVLPSGAYLFAQSQTVQAINPWTGQALAAAPPLPKPNYWEYPLSGSQVMLRAPVLKPNSRTTITFMVFGGGWQAAFFKPCTDFSLRIELDVDCSVSPCTHAFGEWEVETMPGHRGMLDTAVLPNGKVLIINGVEEGLSNLEFVPNGNNVPVNEPWVYDPDAPSGRRYRRTGAYTRIARFYHSCAVLTSHGDVLLGGSTIAEGFTSYHMADFDVTPYHHQDFRIELFKPHYILGPRPAWDHVPTLVEYGATFTVTLAANTTCCVAVVLSDPGTTTHSSNMATRTQMLEFTRVDAGGGGALELSVVAPADAFAAPPGFYLLFAVSADDTYSAGRWIKLKAPWGAPPLSLPHLAQFEPLASTQGESEYVPWAVHPAGTSAANLATQSAAAVGSGTYGMRLEAGDAQPIVLAAPALQLAAGTRVHVFLWARAAADNAVHIEFLLLDTAGAVGGSSRDPFDDLRVAASTAWQQFPLGSLVANASGFFHPALRVSGMAPGTALSLDDIEVYTLTAADAATSLAMARDGVAAPGQLGAAPATAGATRRRLLSAGGQPIAPAEKPQRAAAAAASAEPSVAERARTLFSSASPAAAARRLMQELQGSSSSSLESDVDEDEPEGEASGAAQPMLPDSVPEVAADLAGRSRINTFGNPIEGVTVASMSHNTKGRLVPAPSMQLAGAAAGHHAP